MTISFTHPILDIAQSLLEIKNDLEIINPAFKSLKDFSIKTKELFFEDPKNKNMTLWILLLNSIELIDAIDILVNQSSVYPCYLIVRSLFETKISIEYILKAKTMERSLAWEYFAWKDNIKRLEPYTDTSQDHLRKISQDRYLKNEKFPPENIEYQLAEKQWYETNLQDQRMKPVVDEIDRINYPSPNKKTPLQWYSLFQIDKTKLVSSLDTLCGELDHQGLYLLSYKYLSQFAHSTEYTRYLRIVESKKNSPLLRGKDELWHVVILTSELQAEIIRLYCEFAKRTEQYTEWDKDFELKLNAMKSASMKQFPLSPSNGNLS